MASPIAITAAQKEAINELKRRTINDCSPKMLEDEYVFYRFMKARDFDLKDAEAMIRKHITWRKEYQVDTILTDYKPPEVLLKYATSSFVCFDKDGHVVRYIDVGGSDPKGVLNSCKLIDVMKYNCLLLEQDLVRLEQQSKKLGKPLTTILYIQNYDKLPFSNATYRRGIEFLLLCLKTLQDNYPERIKTVYFINVSIYFTMLYSVLKPFMAAALQQKIKFYGTGEWKEALLEGIDADQLPAFLGGNRMDENGDPLCNAFIIHGQIVPQSYYLPISKRTFSTVPGVKTKKITPFAKANIRFDVNEPGSFLVWEFETKSKDIAFGVFFKKYAQNNEHPEEIITKQRINTCYEPEAGMYKCEKSGNYFIEFDNSYSWLHGKEICYRAKVIGPNEDLNQKWI